MNFSIVKNAVKLSVWFIAMGGQFAWAQGDDRTKMIEAAKKEGRLVWYTSTNLTESKPLLDDFEKQYHLSKAKSFAPAARGRSTVSSPKRARTTPCSIS